MRVYNLPDDFLRLFHQAEPNNHVWMYIRKTEDKERYLSQVAASFVALNQADRNLKTHLAAANGSHFRVPVVDLLLTRWESHLESRRNLSGAFFIREITKAYHEHGIDVISYVRKNAGKLIEDFIAIPSQVKDVLRINVCLAPDRIPAFVAKLLKQVLAGTDASRAIEKLELVKSIPNQSASVNFPTLILYLDRDYVEHAPGSQLAAFMGALENVMAAFNENATIDNTFADPWFNYVNITQGYKLYKVYLNVLEILPLVYAPETNYAYLNTGSGQAFASLLHMPCKAGPLSV